MQSITWPNARERLAQNQTTDTLIRPQTKSAKLVVRRIDHPVAVSEPHVHPAHIAVWLIAGTVGWAAIIVMAWLATDVVARLV